MPPQALIVEDDAITARLLAGIIETEGFDVDVAGDGEVALEMLAAKNYSVILLDIVLPKLSGTAVMEHLRATNPQLLERVIVVTGLDVAEIRALFPTVKLALSKPVLPARLRATVRSYASGFDSIVA
ncbi:MAG TPA: response regulator [Thermoanaerobaculia bacterium]|nr:response regulator [Thermoanaerobaculia bacterium]